MRKDYRNQKNHYKMYKAGKNWLFAGIGVITLASTVAMTTPNAHAAELNNDTNLSSAQKDEQKVTSATPAQQAAIDDAQKDVDQDNADIAQNQKDTADEQANHDTLADQTAGKQSDVDQAQDVADKANDQVDKDQSAVDDAAPADYQDKEDAEQQAQNNADKAQDAVDQATTDKNRAQKDVDNASDKANQAKTAKDDAAKNKADAQDKADAAKNKVDNTDKTTKVHHDSKEPKPGTITTGTEINSEADLPTNLVKPSDADKYNSFTKQMDAGATLNSYWDYIGANDTSEKIKNGILTPQQQLEAAQYALTLINDFRRQHGLKPMKMSTLSLQMAQYDAEMRTKYGVASSDHSFAGSEDQGGVTQTEWNQSILKRLYPSFSGDLSQNYLLGDQDLGEVNADYAPTMLAMKVRILQNIQDMAFADMDWDNGDGIGFHTASLLRDYPGDLWFSLNITIPDNTDYSAMIFDIFGTYDNEIGKQLNKDFNAQPVAEMQSGYDTIETNPAYTNAVNDYNQALSQLTSADKAYNQANDTYNNATNNLNDAKTNLANATTKLETAKSNLNDAKAKLADAKQALADITAQYADQLAAYNQAQATLKNDQAKANQLNQDLANAKKALADNQSSIATSEAKIAQLQDQLKDLQAKLAKDEKTLADAKATAENNDNSDDTNNNGSDDTNSGDDDTNTNNSEDTSDTNNDSNSNNHSDDVIPSQSDTKDSNNTVDITENTQNNNVENTVVTNNTKSFPVTQNVVYKTNNQTVTPAQVAASTFNQSQLPQTGENQQNGKMSIIGLIGLALSSLGLVKLFGRKHV